MLLLVPGALTSAQVVPRALYREPHELQLFITSIFNSFGSELFNYSLAAAVCVLERMCLVACLILQKLFVENMCV